MRKLLIVFFALLLIVAGGGLWVGYQKLVIPRNGQVLGSQNEWPAFWRDAPLYFVGTNEKMVLTGRKADGSLIVPQLPSDMAPKSAAVSPDQQHLVIVAEQGSQSVYWLFEEAKAPKPIAALRGAVRELRFVTDSLVLTKERRAGESTDHLLLLNIENQDLVQVSADSVSAGWVEKPDAVVSVDSHSYFWFHGLQLSGKTDIPQLLGEAVGNVVAIPGQSVILFLNVEEDHLSLKSFNLATKEQRLITMLEGTPAGRALALYVSPDGQEALVILPLSEEQENGSLVAINLATGTQEKVPAIGADLRWLAENEILIERITAGAPQIWLYSFDTRSTTLFFSEPVSAFAS